jgi:hypothetical protein
MERINPITPKEIAMKHKEAVLTQMRNQLREVVSHISVACHSYQAINEEDTEEFFKSAQKVDEQLSLLVQQ